MPVVQRSTLVALSTLAFIVAGIGGTFCAVQIYRTAQMPLGDGSGMQWIILTPLTLLFVGVVLPALGFGRRSLRRLRSLPDEADLVSLDGVIPRRMNGWHIALAVVLAYLFLPLIMALTVGLILGQD